MQSLYSDITYRIMSDTIKKALYVIRKRPFQFFSYFGQYTRFYRTKLLQAFTYSESRGVYLGPNVRIQSLQTLSAELPNARIQIGANSVIYEKAHVEAYGMGQLSIGEDCIIGDARIYARKAVKIGNRVVTSWNVFIQDFDPHPIDPEQRKIQMLQMTENFRPSYSTVRRSVPKLDWSFSADSIEIGDDVWLGANVTILKGAHIGAGSVVAAGSVVTRGQYPAKAILGGSPAKVIKQL